MNTFDFYAQRYNSDNREPGRATTDKHAKLQNLYPHYTNAYFKHARSVYGYEVEGLGYDYSDRLREWDYEKAQESWNVARAREEPETCAFFEAYLSAYFERKVEILHILAGFNVGNGYPYQVFGYRFIDG